MSMLLIDEDPLMILPQLAKAIGLNQAIVLQQMHYWLKKFEKKKDKKHAKNRRWWVYNTAEGWQENFPFWCKRTIERAIKSLREEYVPKDKDDRFMAREALITVANYNDHAYDQTRWYSINYDAVQELAKAISEQCHDESCLDDASNSDDMARPIPEITIDYTEKEEAPPEQANPNSEFPTDSRIPLSLGDPSPPKEEAPIRSFTDPLSMAAEVKRRRGDIPGWAIVGPEGTDPFYEVLLLFCKITRQSPPAENEPKVGKGWLRDLAKLARTNHLSLGEFKKVLPELERDKSSDFYLKNNIWKAPMKGGFPDALANFLRRRRLGNDVDIARDFNPSGAYQPGRR